MTISIAFAEDNIRFRSQLISTLSIIYPDEFDFYIVADNGEELIDKLQAATKLPDFVILDINMPIMNGYETMTIIREKWPTLKVISLSFHNDDYAVVKMLYSGASGYITKDMPPKELHEALITFHKYGRYFAGVSSKFLTTSLSDIRALVPNLTDKEMKFLSLCATEMTYAQMATHLQLSTRTVHSYRDILFKKFDICTRVGLAAFAFRIGLAQPQKTNLPL